ncbi:signal recognition particle receptor beta subunit [Paramuricea clavata]|uniref:Signal recognition particle receptor beta subunit n=1 Tax=Paramuricea clavata TaxID=317549 RepID=A0A7D9EH23_PARCT|nr:signal recognition particle receptor beta subunit [Paramuricea clavata]
MGDVGTGKSTIVEKITGENNRSSPLNESFTKSTAIFRVPDGSLVVADTPGSNSLKEQLQHNVWIAAAINYRPVSIIFIVVKAEARIDCVISNIRKYSDRYIALPFSVIAVLVTHMDKVEWRKEHITPKVKKEIGIDKIAFSSKNTKGEILVFDILKICAGGKVYNLTVNTENFFRLFNIHDSLRSILQSTNDEVEQFIAKKKAFDEARKVFKGNLYFLNPDLYHCNK